jgi:uncharacterized protein YqhQ
MMRGPEAFALAVRRPDGGIFVRAEPRPAITSRSPWLRLPVVRGVAVLAESLAIGFRTLLASAELAAAEAPQGEGPAGGGGRLGRREVNLTAAAALVLAVGLFFVLPTWLANLAARRWHGGLTLNLVEGGVRAAVLLGYLAAIAASRDIQRVLAYHGAEHKAIHALEHGRPLTVSAARGFSRLHPRCGTSFLLFAVLLSIALFALFGWPALWERVLLRLALLPVLAGLGYETLRASAAAERAVRPLVLPGLWLQHLTTREPDDGQLEVALAALRAVLPG